jgi:hypothetical protein
MSSITVPTISKTFFDGYGDFTTFDNEFLGRAEALGLGDYVKSDSEGLLLTRPTRSIITSKYPITTISAERIKEARARRGAVEEQAESIGGSEDLSSAQFDLKTLYEDEKILQHLILPQTPYGPF